MSKIELSVKDYITLEEDCRIELSGAVLGYSGTRYTLDKILELTKRLEEFYNAKRISTGFNIP